MSQAAKTRTPAAQVVASSLAPSAASGSEFASRPLSGALASRFQEVGRSIQRLKEEVGKAIVGKSEVVDMMVVASLTESAHILFEDVPGLAKSVLAATFARATGCTFRRIQFTPDLLPTDITGGYVFDRKENRFEFRKGPVFTNYLLADEINRASPKTQSALLEAMAEKQVSVEGITHRLESPFMVLATQNPIEQEGTYPLPEAQLDRFSMRLSMGYPTRMEEVEILRRRLVRKHDAFDVSSVISRDQVLQMQALVEDVFVDPALLDYISWIIDESRRHPSFVAGCSPRGSLALMKLARAYAVLKGRTYVVPDDVRALAVPVLAHRTILSNDARVRGIGQKQVIEEIVAKTPVPRNRA